MPRQSAMSETPSGFRRKPFTQRASIRKSDALTFLAARSAPPGRFGGVLILEGALKKFLRRASLTAGLACLIVLVTGVAAFAQDAPKPIYDGSLIPASTDVGISLNLLWVVIGAVLVIFMQAGFALVETGFCRKKHAAHVVSTNFAIFGLGFVGFFFVGFPFMFGGYSFPGAFGLRRGGRREGAHRQRELGLPVEGRLGR